MFHWAYRLICRFYEHMILQAMRRANSVVMKQYGTRVDVSQILYRKVYGR